ncbi:MAG: DUF63 family protein [Candidatus Hodarchaeales archaeon]
MVLQQNALQDFIDTLLKDLQFLLTNPIEFFDTYFFSAPGYNLYNTIVYTTVGILAIFLIGKILFRINSYGTERWGEERFIRVRMDQKFFVSILPFIFVGSTLRALQDIAKEDKIIDILRFPYQIFEDRLFVTPGVYVFTILLTLTVGITAIYVSQEYFQNIHRFSDWRFTFFVAGAIIETFLFVPFIPLLVLEPGFVEGGFIIISASIIFALVFNFAANYYSRKFLPDSPFMMEEKAAVITQMFDAFNTVIAIEFFSYQEKHYLPSMIFDTPLGAWPFLVIKLVVVLFFIWALRGLENDNLKKWLLWVVFLLGLATGTRDFLRLITGT